VASTETECDRAEIGLGSKAAGFNRMSGPISLVAAEIHLGQRTSGICDGWLRCNIQVVCHLDSYKIY
jgi:hypothetical protein